MPQYANGKTTTDGIVFMYDTGDTDNSYKGEPTTNRFLVQGTSGFGAAADNNVTFPNQGTGTFIRLGYGQTFGDYTIQPGDVVYKYNLGGYGCHYHGNTSSIPAGAYVTFTFDYYVSPGTTIENNTLANIENYGGGALGTGVTAPNSLLGVWQTVSFTAGPTTSTGTQAMFLYPGGCGPRFGNTGYILYKNPQVEWKSHKTPFVQGTRSDTQGLLDLSGKGSSIDLANVSFDSSAQIYFDATNDRISLTPSTYGITNQFTIEVVCYPTTQVNGMFNFIGPNGSDRGIMAHWPWSSDYGYLDITNTAGGFYRWYKVNAGILNVKALYHFILKPSGQVVVKQNNNVMIPDGTDTFVGNVSLGTSNTIGAFNPSGGLPWGGNIYVFKVYNRALTDAETTQNYLSYKKRFNLS